jgi:hypothetical protein
LLWGCLVFGAAAAAAAALLRPRGARPALSSGRRSALRRCLAAPPTRRPTAPSAARVRARPLPPSPQDEGLRFLASKAEIIDELEATLPAWIKARAWFPPFVHILKFHPDRWGGLT